MKNIFEVFIRKTAISSQNFSDELDLLKREGISSDILKILSERRLGFLGVPLSRRDGQILKNLLSEKLGWSADIIAAKYGRAALIGINSAEVIARRFLNIEIIKNENIAEVWSNNVNFLQGDERGWSFAIGSPSLQAKGVAPGQLVAFVDKLDGHVWSHLEMEYYDFVNNEMEINAFTKKTGYTYPGKIFSEADDCFAECNAKDGLHNSFS